MKRGIVCLGLCLAASPAHADNIALTGGTVHTVDHGVFEDGLVLIRGDRIVHAGAKKAVPKSTTVIDCTGKIVTPGLIDANTHLGAVEISLIPATRDDTARLGTVAAALDMTDAIDLRSTLIGVARRHGVTSAISTPSSGLIRGRSAWLDLVDEDSDTDGAVFGPIAMHAFYNESNDSRAALLLWYQRVLDDARLFAKNPGGYERNALRKLGGTRLDLIALQDVLSRKMRLVINVSRAQDMRALLAMAAREKIRVAFVGAEEAWMLADELARAEVPVIIEPTSNLPARFASRYARQDNAARLVAAGVDVVISSMSSHNSSNLRFLLGNAVRAGLPKDQALEAATLAPARVFGQSRRYGSLSKGRVANVVVWTGDPFEPSSFAETVIIRGRQQSVENRQTRLRARYQKKLGLTP